MNTNRTEFQIQMGLNSNLSLHLQDSMVHIRRLKFESRPLDLAGWIVLAAGPDSNLRFSHQISQFGLKIRFCALQILVVEGIEFRSCPINSVLILVLDSILRLPIGMGRWSDEVYMLDIAFVWPYISSE